MKHVLIGLLAVLVHFGASEIQAMESKVVRIETTNGTRVEVQSTEIERAFHALVADEIAVLEQKAAAIEKLYAFAVAYDGMYMDRPAALAFSEKMAEVVYTSETIATLKDAALYGTSYDGLYLDRPTARAFVEKLMVLSAPGERLRLHKKAFAFALSHQGLYLSRPEALKYANSKSGVPNN